MTPAQRRILEHLQAHKEQAIYYHGDATSERIEWWDNTRWTTPHLAKANFRELARLGWIESPDGGMSRNYRLTKTGLEALG